MEEGLAALPDEVVLVAEGGDGARSDPLEKAGVDGLVVGLGPAGDVLVAALGAGGVEMAILLEVVAKPPRGFPGITAPEIERLSRLPVGESSQIVRAAMPTCSSMSSSPTAPR